MSTQNLELAESVVQVTGSSLTEAQHLLEACGNNVEEAVALFFEGGGGTDGAAVIPDEDDDGVRAPIAPIREQLIMPEDDNFMAAPARLARVSQRVKVCPLRDFAREGALMEEQLQAAASSALDTNYGTHSRPRRRARAAAMVAAAHAVEPKTATGRLGDLFRPPTDIAYAGAFQTARLRSTELKQWLLVNVQSDNFDSQLLNRDVWSDKGLRKVMRRQFMLWQVDSESSEGRRFVAFYHCAKLPYVCVIDPRTGEEVWKSAEPNQSTLLPDLEKFLRENKDFCQEIEDDVPCTSSKRNTECITIDDEQEDEDDKASTSSGHTSGNSKKRTKLMELTEEEQIALAIRNSMRENGVKAAAAATDECNDDNEEDVDIDDVSGFGSIEEFVDDDIKGACERTSYEGQLGTAKDKLTMLKLRLLDVEGADELKELRWPSDTRLEVLRLYIAQQHPHIAKQSYKLICAYPRKTLEAEHDACTLAEMGLHPSANLHVTLDD